MKKKYTLFSLLFGLLFLFGTTAFSLPSVAVSAESSISAGETVMEVSSGRTLSAHNADRKLPMASTTKILTAIIVIEDCNLNETIEIPAAGTGIEGSSVYLKPNEKYTIRQLLYGLMLRSGNDCAVTLALHHSGSIEAFSDVMNERAKRWGANDSHFTNPHGLPDEEHYTTAHDLAVISCHAMQNEDFRKIVSTKYFDENAWKNKNKMLYSYEGANGIKTGYTVRAGRCLVTGAYRSDMQLVCVVLNSPQMYERSAELLDDAFQKYNMQKLYSAEREFIIPTDVKNKTCSLKSQNDFFYPLAEGEQANVRYELPNVIDLPVKQGENKGKVNIYLENQLIFSENLCTIRDVNKSYSDYLNEVIRNF